MILPQSCKKASVALLLGYLTSCSLLTTPSQTQSTDVNRPKVLATTTVLCDLTQQIAGDTVDLTCLLKPGIDAHVYEPIPEDRKAIETAQLIFYSGYNLEPSLIKLIQSSSNSSPKIAVSEAAVAQPIMGEEHEHHENKKMATEQQVPDPHIWHNAENGVRMVEVIQSNLAQLNPSQAKLYRKNAEVLTTELKQINSWIKSQIATIPQPNRKLVTTHDALGYYSAAYNIPVEGALQGLSTEEKPSAAKVKALVDEVKSAKVPMIFAEVVVNPKLIKIVAKDAQVKLSEREIFSDSLGELGSGGDTYPKMLIANTQTIVEGLGGKFKPFELKKLK